ncbi:MAG: helix-turn-helix transcriptional regulator [Clostridia bacterium]|nr:helix-turn-helix transcriptional regulator [Clostridia bacterium]
MSIGNKIYELRTAKNLSQGELAELLDVSRQSVSKWETNTAVPDLDKLMKMCDIFAISLDELTGRIKKEKTITKSTDIERSAMLTSQRIIGYVLLTVSLIGMILSILAIEDSDKLFVLLSLILVILICGLICLFVKRSAGYWCAFVIFSPMSFLSPHIVLLSVFNIVGAIKIGFYLIMAYTAYKQYPTSSIAINKKKTVAVIIGWSICVISYIARLIYLRFSVISSFALNLVLINLITYTAIPFLLTYTVCYIKSKQHKPKDT